MEHTHDIDRDTGRCRICGEDEVAIVLGAPGRELSEALKDLPESMKKFLKRQYAVLDESGEVIEASLMEWARFMGNSQRVIEQEYFDNERYKVSTVFLGLNHQYHPGGKPLWFETMVFGPPHRSEYSERDVRDDLWCERCTTLKEAKVMHREAIGWLRVAMQANDFS